LKGVKGDMKKRIGDYVLSSATEEEVKELLKDKELMRKNDELAMLWKVLMGGEREVSEFRYALWFDITEKLDF
jgi:hypothetical protein